MKSEEVLAIFEQTKALLHGHFELRSGLHSNQYFQCALVLEHPRFASKLCAALAAMVRDGLGAFSCHAVIAPALGGILVGYEVARALDTESIFAEKQEGKLVLRRGFRIVKGETYVIAEDVVTRGGRVQETIDIVEQAGGRIAGIAVLVDRSGGKAPFKYPMFSLVQMEPVTYEPAACPLCASGVPMNHPGS